MPSLQLIKTHEARVTLHGRFDNGKITGGASFVFEGLRAGKSQDYLDAIGFQIFKFF